MSPWSSIQHEQRTHLFIHQCTNEHSRANKRDRVGKRLGDRVDSKSHAL